MTYIGLTAVNSMVQNNIKNSKDNELKISTIASDNSSSTASAIDDNNTSISSVLENNLDSFTAQNVIDLIYSTLILNGIIIYLI